MKTAECVQERHGACDGHTLVEQEVDGIAICERVDCPCWCHRRPIPAPGANEPAFNLHLDRD